MTLLEKYGHCIIRKGTKLYRKGPWDEELGVYFTFHPSTAFSDSPLCNGLTQEWEVICDVELIFLVSYIDSRQFPLSSMGKLYSELTQDTYCGDDLEIKYRDRQKRSNFVQKLRNNKLKGWFCSMEDTPPVEAFLLTIDLCVRCTREFLYKPESMKTRSTLKKVEFYPSKHFWYLSTKSLENSLTLSGSSYRRKTAGNHGLFEELYLSEKYSADIEMSTHGFDPLL